MFRVLIIDDEEDIVALLRYTLERAFYDVEVAKDGLEGLKKFQNTHFDAVITDIKMPVLDGYHVAHHIRSSDRSCTPIIAISGTRLTVSNGAFNSVLLKPFSLNKLLKLVAAYCTEPLDNTACG
jgi:DNA-binding response OmpR family regulator